jgi:hypothetical protein
MHYIPIIQLHCQGEKNTLSLCIFCKPQSQLTPLLSTHMLQVWKFNAPSIHDRLFIGEKQTKIEGHVILCFLNLRCYILCNDKQCTPTLVHPILLAWPTLYTKHNVVYIDM